MPHPRRLATPLLVVAALIAAATFLVAPASAQEPTIKVIVIGNDTDNDKERKERWQMQVSVHPTGGCTPTQGDRQYVSSWLDADAETGVELSIGECVFRIDVSMRQANFRTDCWYTAQLTWDPAGDTTPVEDYVLTSDRPDGVGRLSAVRKATSACAFPPDTRFYIDGTEVVENLPGSSANVDLLELTRRAAKIATFAVRVEPDDSAGAVPAGCNRTATLVVRGDGVRVPQVLQTSNQTCPFRAVVTRAEAPFEAIEGGSVTFTDDFRIIDLTSLVRLPQARIAIIQDVRGSENRGSASYTITRSCGDVTATSPPATGSAPLHVGRFTVHAPSAPSSGATAIYPAAAADADADTIVGCSVTASVRRLPDDCVVDGGSSQTLTWSAAAPVRNFDFEFDITCGTAAVTPPTTPPTTTVTATPATQPAEDMEPLEDATPVDPEPDSAPEDPEGPVADMPTG